MSQLDATVSRPRRRAVRRPVGSALSYVEVFRAEPIKRIGMIKSGLRAAEAKRILADLAVTQAVAMRALNIWICQLSRQKCTRRLADAASLRCGENGERGCGATEMKHAAAVGGDMLVVAAARAEVVAKFIVAATEALCRDEALEPAHTSDPALDAPVILFEPVVPVDAGAVGGICQLSRQKCTRRLADAASLRCGENGERGCGATEMKHAAAVGG
ncbi:hypothetical protein, partial [Roseomonas chloroacetimidivorans]|uniref:hypothetical protein n=1 Tax=Roseomonas chloroacetimidivorans TaxID=1766656 RepID=UPI003C756337